MNDQRLDVFLSEKLEITRNYAQKLIRNGHISLNGIKLLKPSIKVSPSHEIQAEIPPPERLDFTPEEVPFNVVFEDKSIIVLNKPAGVVVHPGPGNWSKTLVHGLLFRYPDIVCGNVGRPGIVHRLDATTSGLMIVARNGKALERLQRMFQVHEVEKNYIALVYGDIKKNNWFVDAPIDRDPRNRVKMAIVDGGKNARTEFSLIWSKNGYSLLSCRLISGRTHQIRVHLSATGHPIVGDELYGEKRHRELNEKLSMNRVFLHSWRLKFAHPETGEHLSFGCTLPKELLDCLKFLE